MLKTTQIAAVNDAAEQLRAAGNEELANQLTDIVKEQLSHHAKSASRRGATNHRPPEVRYAVALGDQWQITAIGARAVHEIITETLKEHGGGPVPTLGSLRAMLSNRGAWYRLLDTDTGSHALEVRRLESGTKIA